MDDSDDETNKSSSELDIGTREMMITNEMRSFKNRGFHDGYDEGKNSTIQGAFDTGYRKAFEQNFILSTLKGVAHALKSSYNLNSKININRNQRPNSLTPTISSTSSSQSACGDISSASSSSGGSRSSINVSNAIPTPPPSSTITTATVSSTTRSSNINVVNISNNHLSLLESMKFDDASDIESIKNDLVKICRENRLEILAHYVSQIG